MMGMRRAGMGARRIANRSLKATRTSSTQATPPKVSPGDGRRDSLEYALDCVRDTDPCALGQHWFLLAEWL